MRTRCDFTVASVTERVAAISRFDKPCARQASTSRSRALSRSGPASTARNDTEPASACWSAGTTIPTPFNADAIGTLQRRDADRFAAGVRLRDHVGALRLQHRRHAEASQRQLVDDDGAFDGLVHARGPPGTTPRPTRNPTGVPTVSAVYPRCASMFFSPRVDQVRGRCG